MILFPDNLKQFKIQEDNFPKNDSILKIQKNF